MRLKRYVIRLPRRQYLAVFGVANRAVILNKPHPAANGTRVRVNVLNSWAFATAGTNARAVWCGVATNVAR